MGIEQQVTGHYTRDMIEQKILLALRDAGKNPETLTSGDLEQQDNLHLGGREAVANLAGFMDLRPGMHLLDVGCGIGGPARYFAEKGCQVTGIDLTPEFVRVAGSLTRMLKLQGKAQFQQGSALEMPFASGTFDGAYMIHVGMNIGDKVGVFREVARVTKPGGRFAIFDIMSSSDEELAFPMPWAMTAENSFVKTVEDYRSALETAGFRIEHQRSGRQFAIEFIDKMRAAARAGAPPVLGVHVMMGEQAPVMMKNVNEAIMSGKLEPVELVACCALASR